MPFYVYILKCSNGTFYTGNTSNLSLRVSQHMSGYNPKSYTHRLRPAKLVWAEEFEFRYDALAIEKQIKGWSHAKKQALIEDDFDKIHQIVKNERMKREVKIFIINL
ncbi:MAG: GIY-YIG nuclease family protein [Chloroflexi bacterium]|nr:GIY-YIG nuclease family protein [Chloroflexota bacterium]